MHTYWHIAGRALAAAIAVIAMVFALSLSAKAGHGHHGHAMDQHGHAGHIHAIAAVHSHHGAAKDHSALPCPMTLSQTHCDVCLDIVAVQASAVNPRKLLASKVEKVSYGRSWLTLAGQSQVFQPNRVRGPPSRIAPIPSRIVALKSRLRI